METKTIQLANGEEKEVIKPHSRQGWAEAAKEAHKQGDDKLLIQDVFNAETFEDWTSGIRRNDIYFDML